VVRTVTRDLDFHGIPLKKGDRVLLSSVLAARDQTAYDQADDVILGRHPNRHMGFGAGAHRCLGIHIARVQLRLALEEFHKKIPEYELVSPEATTYHAGGNIGLNELRIRWNR
jgi:cytochrome P450